MWLILERSRFHSRVVILSFIETRVFFVLQSARDQICTDSSFEWDCTTFISCCVVRPFSRGLFTISLFLRCTENWNSSTNQQLQQQRWDYWFAWRSYEKFFGIQSYPKNSIFVGRQMKKNERKVTKAGGMSNCQFSMNCSDTVSDIHPVDEEHWTISVYHSVLPLWNTQITSWSRRVLFNLACG